jgi:hypothetical protein
MKRIKDSIQANRFAPLLKKSAITFICIIVAVSLYYTPPGLRLPVLDDQADTFFTEAIQKAGVVYATCRLLNAAVSIAKNTTMDATPAGVGLSVSIGQLLDPIDDMIERVSDILVTSISSLGVQKIAYEIMVYLVPSILAVCLLIVSILIWFKAVKIASMRKQVLRIMFLMMVARCCLPVSALVNNYLQSTFFDVKITEAKEKLFIGSDALDEFKDLTLPEFDGWQETITGSVAFVKKKSIDFKNLFFGLIDNSGNIISSLITLSFIFIAVFIIQVVALPILAFWIIVKLANSLFSSDIPVVLDHSKIAEKIHR